MLAPEPDDPPGGDPRQFPFGGHLKPRRFYRRRGRAGGDHRLSSPRPAALNIRGSWGDGWGRADAALVMSARSLQAARGSGDATSQSQTPWPAHRRPGSPRRGPTWPSGPVASRVRPIAFSAVRSAVSRVAPRPGPGASRSADSSDNGPMHGESLCDAVLYLTSYRPLFACSQPQAHQSFSHFSPILPTVFLPYLPHHSPYHSSSLSPIPCYCLLY